MAPGPENGRQRPKARNQRQQRGMGIPRCNVPAEIRGQRPTAASRTSTSTPTSSSSSSSSFPYRCWSAATSSTSPLPSCLPPPPRPPPPPSPGPQSSHRASGFLPPLAHVLAPSNARPPPHPPPYLPSPPGHPARLASMMRLRAPAGGLKCFARLRLRLRVPAGELKCVAWLSRLRPRAD